jgi:putative ABC transport system permease protein
MVGLWKKALRDLLTRRVRSALTILGIAVGVAGLVAITSTARNLERAQRQLYVDTSQADITFWVWDLPPSSIPLLEADERVAAATVRWTYSTKWRVHSRWMDIVLIGIEDWSEIEINEFDVIAGRRPGMGEILLEDSARDMTQALSLTSGAIGVGETVFYRDQNGRERQLQVSGISRSPGNLSSSITQTAIGYVPAAMIQRLRTVAGGNQLLIKLHDLREAREVAERVSSLLRRQGIQVGEPDIRDPDNFAGRRELDALIMIMFLFSGLGLLLSAFLVINTLSAIIGEQVGEIGVLKTVGATRGQVLLIYALEALAYGVAGTVAGIVGGAIVGWRLLVWVGGLGNATVAFRIAPEGVLLGSAVGLAVAGIAGLVPALQAASISVAQAITSHGIRSDYGASWLDRQLSRIRRLPPLAAMALRNLSRRGARSVFTVGVVALSTAAFLSAMATRESVDSAIDGVYRTYAADAWVSLGQQVGFEFEELLTTVEGVHEAEGWALANGVVGLAEARLWGIPADSHLYRQVLREGRWYRSGETDGVVLSSELADNQDLRVGDRVELQYERVRQQFRVVGIAIDNTIFLGGALSGKAFMPREMLTRMIGSQGLVSFFALGLDSRDPAETNRVLADLETRFARYRPSVQPVYVEIESAQEASLLLTLGLLAMVLIVTLVGALGILNTLTLNVLDRRREIAVLRAMGARDAALVLIYLAEGVALGGLGWLIGSAVAYPVGRLFVDQMSTVLFDLPFILTWRALAWSFLFTLGLAAISSLGPALAAARVPVSVGLRYE